VTRTLRVLALALALAACTEGDEGEQSPSDAGADPGPGFDATVANPTLYEFPCLEAWEPTGASTYSAIFHELLCTHGCSAPYCHGSRASSGGLSFETLPLGHASLLQSEPDPSSLCATRRRVVPGDPEASLLYLKISGEAGCGQPMPPPDAGWPALDEADRQRIADWIRAGARDD